MYRQYFGLSELPFSIAPDPRYLFLSDKHREALAHLIYGVGDQGGFVLLTGEVGTGKTTVCRCLLQQIPENTDVAFIINPKQSINQLLQSICSELDIAFDLGMSSKDLIDALNRYLLDAHSRGRNTILIIDEAQNLPLDILEQLRLLTNLETNDKKLLQLVLLGQPELNELLESPQLRQLAQRITARYHLTPLSRREVESYIQHRLAVAGCRSPLFNPAAIRKISKISKGVPRVINLLCDRALLGVYALEKDQVTASIINRSAREVLGYSAANTVRKWARRWLPLTLSIAVVMLVALLLWSGDLGNKDKPQLLGEQAVSVPAPPANDWLETASGQSLPDALAQLAATIDYKNNLNCDGRGFLHQGQWWYCQAGPADWSALKGLNEPGIIEFEMPHSKAPSAVVLEAEHDAMGQLQVAVDGKTYSLSPDMMAKLHINKTFLLSRIPPGLDLPIKPGAEGRSVRWLELQLSKFSGGLDEFKYQLRITDVADGKLETIYSHLVFFPIETQARVYDENLQARVVAVQRKLGIEGDEVVVSRKLLQSLMSANRQAKLAASRS